MWIKDKRSIEPRDDRHANTSERNVKIYVEKVQQLQLWLAPQKKTSTR